MIELILALSALNLLLNAIAIYQRHETLKHHRRNGGRE
jgi:hypothetical protein